MLFSRTPVSTSLLLVAFYICRADEYVNESGECLKKYK